MLTDRDFGLDHAGVQAGKFHITDSFIGHVFRTSTAGASTRNSYVFDIVHGVIGYVSRRTPLLWRSVLIGENRWAWLRGAREWTRWWWGIGKSTGSTFASAVSCPHHDGG